jgi:hypothetical protein
MFIFSTLVLGGTVVPLVLLALLGTIGTVKQGTKGDHQMAAEPITIETETQRTVIINGKWIFKLPTERDKKEEA